MRRASWRWGAATAVVAVLVALPSMAGALPVHVPAVAPAELLTRIRASSSVGWSGYTESTGTLVLPDVKELSTLPALLGGTTRMRAWWRGARDWRVDTLSLASEVDTTRDDDGGWTWDPGNQRATRLYGTLDVHLPLPSDLLPPVLGRRLAGAKDVTVASLPGRRIAGRSAAGIRLSPKVPDTTTIAAVDIWAEPRTGLPLRVDVLARGARRAAVSSTLLDLSLSRPGTALTAFEPPPYTDIRVNEAPDIAARINQFSPYSLPDELIGSRRRDVLRAVRPGGGIATYGAGLTSFAVLPLPRSISGRLMSALAPTGGDGTRGEITTPLMNAVVDRIGDRTYLVAGTVPLSMLDRVLDQLRASPPIRLEDQ